MNWNDYGARDKLPDRGTQEGHALSLSPYSPLLRSLTPTPRYCRAGEIDRIWMIPPLFKTDEELSGRSLCLWWTRCAVRGYGGPPRPPIGRERRDREQYRHEGTNNPPPYPPPSGHDHHHHRPPPRDSVWETKRDERNHLDKDDVTMRGCDGKREMTAIECAREGGRWKHTWTIDRFYISFFLFFSHFGFVFFSL